MESQISQWRAYVLRRDADDASGGDASSHDAFDTSNDDTSSGDGINASSGTASGRDGINASDGEASGVGQLEAQLREYLSEFQDKGLKADEALLLALKRTGNSHEQSRDFLREHPEWIWQQPVLTSSSTLEDDTKPTAAQDSTTKPLAARDSSKRPLAPQDASAKLAAAQDSSTKPTAAQNSSTKPPAAQDSSTRPAAAYDSSTKPTAAQDSLTKMAAAHDFLIMVGAAIAAALAVKAPAVFGYGDFSEHDWLYQRNISLLVLPILAGYFAWKRGLKRNDLILVALPFAAIALFANVFPFTPDGATQTLTSLHVPVAGWLMVGLTYTGGDWRATRQRLEFVLFTGEWLIYYALIALGGGLLMGLTAGVFSAIDISVDRLLADWVLPCGAVGAVIVAAWLVEAQQGIVKSVVSVLTRIFTPLFAGMLIAFLAAAVWTTTGIDVDRDLLLVFDSLLIVVVALLLYTVAARDRQAPRDKSDVFSLILIVSALITDLLAIIAVIGRIYDFGFTAKTTAVLGLNLILFVNLAWSAWLSVNFLRGRYSFSAIEDWQARYASVYAVWAALVIVAFPPIFAFG